MKNFTSVLFTLPILIWCVFQPALYTNAMLVEQSLSSAIYETQKEASLKGKYDDEIYQKILNYLEEVHRFDVSEVEINATETLTRRGERMYIEISIPKPPTSVIEIFSTGNEEPYRYEKYIMSEYVD